MGKSAGMCSVRALVQESVQCLQMMQPKRWPKRTTTGKKTAGGQITMSSFWQTGELLIKLAGMPETINFYSTGDEYGCFSNFAPYPIRLDGKSWPTSEHYFQAQKFEDAQHREAIRT